MPPVSSPVAVPAERPAGLGTQRERVPVLIFDSPGALARQVARHVAALVEAKRAVGERAVLGLPTGSTPLGVYEELIRLHREDGLDLSNVVAFNLDEYYPVDPGSLQSFHRFMRENFFDHVNIAPDHVHIPRGDVAPEEVEEHCRAYERAIERAGGLDLVLLGIGRSGHIGFNEPGSGRETRTRLVVLDEITRKDAASDFFGEEHVPREAITMGVGTILDAREVILMATGEHKAPIVRRAVEEEPNREVTASYLQLHRDAAFYVDRAAASALTREATPWLVREVAWTAEMAKRAVIWLSEQTGKALLRLDAADFHEHHLHGLVRAYPSVDELCLTVFEDLRRRVTYRDGLPRGRRVVVFSPHPDDDVISMGGMLDKLVANENTVTVAYMTNGSVAVFDGDVKRYLRFVRMSLGDLAVEGAAAEAARAAIDGHIDFVRSKRPAEVDTDAVQRLKAHVRYAEAIHAIEVLGLHAADARFLDLPFYKTGLVRKNPIGEGDIQIVLGLLDETRPHHVFVAGDLSDPHGTHRMCYAAIAAALDRYEPGAGADAASNGEGRRPLVWLYRGAWQEWEIHRADVFLPMSKADLDRKIEAIFKHESQKDRAMFPGAYDAREFWQRARDRNRETARALDRLGLPEFYAAEAYVVTEQLP
ncbi:MAG TPA: glucosamine-6-phosphate deaminase [Rubricoccaceae bacterium]|nr:glucosamine-6-phosphate deaminase [Rubricoccaceae bacterium]